MAEAPSSLEDIKQRHQLERKELQASIQKLKHGVPKGDKKRKKEVNVEIALLEQQLTERHERELEAPSNLVEKVDNLTLSTTDSASADQTAASTSSSGKTSKAQRRREKKEQEDRDRAARLAAAEAEAANGPRATETTRIQTLLRERDLMIRDVPSNGDCMYAAVGLGLQPPRDVTALRRVTAEHLRQHPADYQPFMTSAEGELMDEEGYRRYCDVTENTTAWGGQLELRALATHLGVQIEVVQAEGPVVLLGQETSDQKIIVTYHRHAYGLGEHYNAVQPYLEDEDD